MSNKYHNIAIALAGVCQSAVLVPQLANTGACSSILYRQSVMSIFNTSPQSAEDVYGGAANLKTGLQTLTQILSANQREQAEIIRYVFGSLGITNKLRTNDNALEKISQRLDRIQGLYTEMNSETIEPYIDELSYSLAGIYADIVSPLTSKIKVIGKPEFLQNSLVQAKVRTSLFGCVRSATLWYQVGGNRPQFFLSRKSIVQAAQDILNHI